MIFADGISKSFSVKGGRRSVLRDLSFEVPAGAHFAILGGKGSGKTSLLKLIGGLDHPDRGRIRCRGTVSWIFAQMRFEKAMSINQNMRFLCRVLGEPDFDRVADEVRALTGFDEQLKAPVDRLRPIQNRQLTCALSLCFDFDILLLDSRPVFFNLENAEAYREKFEERMARSTVVLATDNPQEIAKSFRYFLVLGGKSGRMYDKRGEAVKAFREINNIPAPDEGDGNTG